MQIPNDDRDRLIELLDAETAARDAMLDRHRGRGGTVIDREYIRLDAEWTAARARTDEFRATLRARSAR